MEFSREQQIAFDKYLAGENVFISGAGGTGKSTLIKHIQQDACKKGAEIHVCALTGRAAVLLNCKAKTIHSWAKIGLGNGTIEQNVAKILKNRYAKPTWKNTNILVIDEVSMMSQKLFEMLDAIGKAIRKSYKPFGGIQLIFSGDFYQLPPVGNRDEPETSNFCFESPLWLQTFGLQNHVCLTTIYRQNDPVYQNILNQIREGKLKRSSNQVLLHQVGKEIPKDCLIRPTKLFPTRNMVDCINMNEMNKLAGREYEYKIKYHTDLEITASERTIRLDYTKEQIQTELMYLKSNLRCDETVKLKIGAQVMCIVNIQLSNGDLLCNGAQGIVVDISPQGLPIVKYNNGYQMTMSYFVWQSELIPGVGLSQIPLVLAWAMTIHKAQGSTLELSEIDAGTGIFECGQTYVALSRVKSLEGLYLSSFDARRIRVNRKVQEFYAMLKEQNDETVISETVISETVSEKFKEFRCPIKKFETITKVETVTNEVNSDDINEEKYDD